MVHFGTPLLCTWNRPTMKSEIRQQSTLQDAQFFCEKQFAEVTLDFAPLVVVVPVIAVVQPLEKIRGNNSNISFYLLSSFCVQLAPFDTKASAQIYTFAKIKIPKSRCKAPATAILALNALR